MLFLTPMPRWFNTAGPCQAENHYMLPPLTRLPQVKRLIAQHSYFVIHAPRQIGKTTIAIVDSADARGQRQIEGLAVPPDRQCHWFAFAGGNDDTLDIIDRLLDGMPGRQRL